MTETAKRRYITTTWAPVTYDVWGNARDGWEVNNTYRSAEVTLRLEVVTLNAGTPYAFDYAHPSKAQIRRVLGLGRTRWTEDREDLDIYAERTRDGYPLGGLTCTSHRSLSPIRKE